MPFFCVVATQQVRSDNDAMYVYTADDFSEDSLQRTTFGIKFKDAEVGAAPRASTEFWLFQEPHAL